MTDVVVIPSETGELRRRWITVTVAAAVVAAALPVVAGGPGLAVHLALGAVTVAGFTLAALRRQTIVLPTGVALLSVLIVADTARVDRAVVALPTSIAVLLAIECAVVARRLDTVAPVSSTAHDAAALAGLLVVASAAGVVVAVVAQLDTFGVRALAVGAMVALGLVGIVLRGRPDADNPG